MSFDISEIKRIVRQQEVRNALWRNRLLFAGGVAGAPLVFALQDGRTGVELLLWAAPLLCVVGAGYAVHEVFTRRDARHDFLWPGLFEAEYEFIEADGEQDVAGDSHRHAERREANDGPRHLGDKVPARPEQGTPPDTGTGETAEPDQHKTKTEANAAGNTEHAKRADQRDADRAGQRVPSLERLPRPDPRHSTTPVSDTAAPIQPPRVRNVER